MHLRKVLTIIMVGLAATAIVFAGCANDEAEEPSESRADASLPRLVDLGRGTCIPCKKMAPILEEIEKSYRGQAIVEVIDLRDDPGAASEYGIRLIPTQIFLDATGKEVWRHEGFLARDAIVAKFTEMGVEPIGD